MTRRAFTPDEEAEILQMRAVGIPTKDILEQFGYHRKNAVYSLFRRAGVQLAANGPSARLWAPAEQERAIRSWAEGHGVTAIARELARSTTSVRRVLEDAGIEVERRRKAVRPGEPWLNGGGYWLERLPSDHPFAAMRAKNGSVMQHRLRMAEHLGRPLARWETVHHIDGDRRNNDITNLQLRQGLHGNGIRLQCAACGCDDLVAAPLGDNKERELS